MSQNLFSAIMLLDIAVKAVLLLSVTAMGAFLLRKRSAATVHRWWVLGFIGCLAIPAIALIAPTRALPILPESLLVIETLPNDRSQSVVSQEISVVSNPLNNAPSMLATQEQRGSLGPDVGVKSLTPPTESLSTLGDPLQTNKSTLAEFSWAKALWVLWWLWFASCEKPGNMPC